MSIKKTLGSFGFDRFLGGRHNWGKSWVFWMTSSGLERKFKGQILCFFILKLTRRESASLEPVIGFLALAVGKLWSENQ